MRKSYRVKKETEFQQVFETRNSYANRQFVISVGKKIGNAVARNWVKRRIRQSITELKPQLKQDADFLVIARPTVAGKSQAETKAYLSHALKLAHLLDND